MKSSLGTAVAMVLDVLADEGIHPDHVSATPFPALTVTVQVGTTAARQAAVARLGLRFRPPVFGDVHHPLAMHSGQWADIQVKVIGPVNLADVDGSGLVEAVAAC